MLTKFEINTIKQGGETESYTTGLREQQHKQTSSMELEHAGVSVRTVEHGIHY